MMSTPTSKARAFTLVELLVVIGIIALLISILLPALRKARLASLDLMCQSNLRQVGMAAMQYATDWKGVLPTDGGAQPVPPATSNKYWYIAPTRWYEKLQTYRVYNPASDQRGRTPMNCPLLQSHISGLGVTGPNSDYAVTAMMGGLTEHGLSPPGQVRIRVPKVRRLKATTAWMMDSGAYFTGSPRVVNNNWVVSPHRDKLTLYPQGVFGWSWDMPWMWAADRGDGIYGSGPFRGQGHGGRQNNFANVLFGDGHVDQVTAQWVRSLSGSIQVNNDGGPHNEWTGKPKDE